MSHHFRDHRTSTTDRAWQALAAAACGGAVFFGTLPAQANDGIGLWKKPTTIRSAQPENGFATSIRSFLAQSQQRARAGQWAAAEALAQRAQRMSIAAAPSLRDYPDCQPDAIAQVLEAISRKEVPTGIAMAPLPASTVIQVLQPPAPQTATMPAPQPAFPATPRYEATYGAPQVARISAAPVQPAGPGQEAPVELTNSIATARADEQDIPPSPAPAVPAPTPTVAHASAASEPAATSDSPTKAPDSGSNEAKRYGALPAWKPVESAASRHVVEVKPGPPAIRPATGTSFFQSSRFTVVANQAATAKKPIEAPAIEETATVDESVAWFTSLPELPNAEELAEDELFVPVRPLPSDSFVWARQPVESSSVAITPADRPTLAPKAPEPSLETATMPVAMANEGASIRVLEWKSVDRPGSQEVITAELSASPSAAVAPTPDADKTTAGNPAADETIEQTGFRDGDWTVNTTTSTGGFAFERAPLELARSPLSEDDATLFAPSVIVDRTPVSADGLLLDEPQPAPAAGESTWFERFAHGKSIPRQTVIAFSLAAGLLILLSITSFVRRRSSR